MSDKKTIAEQLDAAPDGAAFGRVLLGLMSRLDEQRFDEEDHE